MPPKASPVAGARPTSAAAAAASAEASVGWVRAVRQRPPPAERAEQSAQVLFLVLENLRHAAREARVAARRELCRMDEAGDGTVPPAWFWTVGGDDADDGEDGAVAGGGFWRPPARLWTHSFHDSEDPRREAYEYEYEEHESFRLRDNDLQLGAPPLDADRAFFETLQAAAGVCKPWRRVAVGAADRATLSWEGIYRMGCMFGAYTWKRAPPTSRPRHDPLALLRSFPILRALCLRGEPDNARRLRAFLRALGVVSLEPQAGADAALLIVDPEDACAANVLRRLTVLRIEFAQGLVDALTPARLARPLPSPPLLSSLVTLEIERLRSTYLAPADGPSAYSLCFSRTNLPSLRSLGVSITRDSDCPFDLNNGARDDAAFLPPLLSRLRVSAEAAPPEYRGRWPRGEYLLASVRSLGALAPTLQSLSIGRAATRDDRLMLPEGKGEGEGDDGQSDPRAPRPVSVEFISETRPMARLLPCLGPLSRLTSLELNSGRDWSPGWGGSSASHGPWLLAARDLMRSLAPLLKVLRLGDSTDGPGHACAILPPALSLLTALSRLEVRTSCIHSLGPLRFMPWLKSLTAQYADLCEGDSHICDWHPPVLDRDLEALTRLEYLCMSHTARCYGPVLENGLPELRTLVLRDFGPRALGRALLRRMQRDDDLAVFMDQVEYKLAPPRLISAADLKAMVQRMEVEPVPVPEPEPDDEDEDEGYWEQPPWTAAREHEHEHNELIYRVKKFEREDAEALAVVAAAGGQQA